ncbi:type IX secretion system protein PorQ [Barnesiella propionica]|uniref:type IX secretion system protein PorQ n=1 Tax=Barnesiella propionica TaxID=2981781 RepID=UPI0011C75533|nr:type IX secretion system protein PorQ [Barnesiella propionica]MCU6768360.1 type IX secretion system protein PorQ [Barnesiella propionica]
MNRLKYRLLLLVLAWVSITAYGQEGKSSFDFLNITSSSHVYALGGNNISIIEDDISLINQNPALLGPELNLQLGLNYMHYVGGINLAGASFAKAAGENGAWAAGIQYYGYGKMKQTDETGMIMGEFSPKDIVFNGMYSHNITNRLRGGINTKFLYSSYEQYTSLALAVDLGINYYRSESDLSLSLVIKNLGGQIKKYNETFERMPWDIQLGYTQSLEHAPVRVSVTAHHLTRWKLPYLSVNSGSQSSDSEEISEKGNFASDLFRHLVFGIDVLPTDNIYLAVGYNYKTRTDMKTYARNILSGFSIGAGIRVKMFGIGVALGQQHVSGTTFMFNLSTNLFEFKK